MYIHDNKPWEMLYVIIRIMFPCIRVLCLVDNNHAGMEKVNYQSRITKQCIEKQSIIFIIKKNSKTYHYHTINGTRQMIKVPKKSHYQMILLIIQKIYVLS